MEVAFKSIDNYFEFFKDVDEIYRSKENTLKSIISELEFKYADLLNDKPKKQDEFLIPEIPKFKKEVKDKRESSRASRRNPSELSKVNTTQKDLFNSNDSEIIRRSSRIASKTKLKPSNVIPQNGKSENGVQDCTYIVSPSHPPTKIRRTSDIEQKRNEDNRSALEESVCTADMKQPLGASTPTSPPLSTPKAVRKSTDMAAKKTNSDEENKTPTSDAARGKIESVKKRIEEFEKRAKGHLLPSKLPIKSPDKSKLMSLIKNTSSNVSNTKKEVFTEDESSVSEARVLRANTKVLQEKNANVKISKEKVLEAQKKKAAMIRASTEEKQRKREERGRKVAAQREAAEKEKQLAAMKSEKEKEQKLKQIQKLKDEKYKEEYLKKKQLAAMKAAEMEERRKQQEEAARLAKLKKTQAAKEEIPQYGIDNVLEGDSSEDEDNPKKQIPSWASKKNREYPLMVQGWLNKRETVYPWFYNKNLKYPKLEELFSIEVKSRPRTSSAFWNSRICFNESFPLM
ncbi:inner centromere protein A-like isoform X2 [Planococcus citri]|uniref:inner centromere protein A-like isoform X2 n=1 Tax=Planococcus citri TaxID=170843 RepID=UPI0031F79275